MTISFVKNPDPGAQFGRGLSEQLRSLGLTAGKMRLERDFLNKAFDDIRAKIDEPEYQKTPYLSQMMDIMQAGAGVPQWDKYISKILPLLQAKEQLANFDPSFGGQQQQALGGIPSEGQAQINQIAPQQQQIPPELPSPVEGEQEQIPEIADKQTPEDGFWKGIFGNFFGRGQQPDAGTQEISPFPNALKSGDYDTLSSAGGVPQPSGIGYNSPQGFQIQPTQEAPQSYNELLAQRRSQDLNIARKDPAYTPEQIMEQEKKERLQYGTVGQGSALMRAYNEELASRKTRESKELQDFQARHATETKLFSEIEDEAKKHLTTRLGGDKKDKAGNIVKKAVHPVVTEKIPDIIRANFDSLEKLPSLAAQGKFIANEAMRHQESITSLDTAFDRPFVVPGIATAPSKTEYLRKLSNLPQLIQKEIASGTPEESIRRMLSENKWSESEKAKMLAPLSPSIAKQAQKLPTMQNAKLWPEQANKAMNASKQFISDNLNHKTNLISLYKGLNGKGLSETTFLTLINELKKEGLMLTTQQEYQQKALLKGWKSYLSLYEQADQIFPRGDG